MGHPRQPKGEKRRGKKTGRFRPNRPEAEPAFLSLAARAGLESRRLSWPSSRAEAPISMSRAFVGPPVRFQPVKPLPLFSLFLF